MKHIEFEKLLRGFEGLRSPAEEREEAEHLRSCAECARLAAGAESFFRYVKAVKSAEVPQADTARLLNIFQPKKLVSAEKESKLKKLLASLVFDDWLETDLPQERLAVSDSRHLLYRAGEFEVELRISFAADGKCQVSGQVFPDCSAPEATAEFRSAETSETVFLNDYGEFVFSFLNEGIYDFRIDSGETIIEIEAVSLVN
jgi:hypothetical protein